MKLSRHPSRGAGRDLHIITRGHRAALLGGHQRWWEVSHCVLHTSVMILPLMMILLRTIINIPWKSPAQEATAIKSAIITVSLKENRLDSFDPASPRADLWYPLLVTAGSPHNYLWPSSNVSMFEAICTCWESNWNVRAVAAWPQADLITAVILIGKLSVSKHLGTNQPLQPSQMDIINMM